MLKKRYLSFVLTGLLLCTCISAAEHQSLMSIFSESSELEPLLKELKSNDISTRINAVKQLGKLDDKRAINELVLRALQDKSDAVKEAALSAIGFMHIRLTGKCESYLHVPLAQEFGKRIDVSVTPEQIQYLIEILTNKSSRENTGAADVLVRIGPAVSEPLWITVQSRSREIRKRIMTVLARIGDKRAIEMLVAKLEEEEDYQERNRVIFALSHASSSACELLSQAAKKENDSDRYSAIDALVKMGQPAVETLLDLMQHENWKIRFRSTGAFAKIRDQRAVGPLIQALRDEDINVRLAAVGGLKYAGTFAVAPLLAELAELAELEGDSWHYATRSLAFLGDSRAAAPLLEAYYGQDKERRISAASHLAILARNDDPNLINIVVSSLQDPDEQLRSVVASSIARHFWKRNPLLYEPLLAAMNDQSPRVRRSAIRALEIQAEKQDERVVKKLLKALRDDNFSVRSHAAYCLEALKAVPKSGLDRAWYLAGWRNYNELATLGEDGVAPLLLFLRAGHSSREREQAALTLEKIGPPAVQPLIKTLRDRNLNAREQAAQILEWLDSIPDNPTDKSWYLLAKKNWSALEQMGENAYTPLLFSLQDPDAIIRQQAVRILAKTNDHEIHKQLMFALEDDNKFVRMEAMAILSKIDENEAIPLLQKALALQGYFPEIRRLAVQELGEIGTENAIDLLIQVIQDHATDYNLCNQASTALIQTGSPYAVHKIILLHKTHNDLHIRKITVNMLEHFDTKDFPQAHIWYLIFTGNYSTLESYGKHAVEGLLWALDQEENNKNIVIIITTLTQIGDNRAINPLTILLDHEDSWIRKITAEALCKLNDKPVNEHNDIPEAYEQFEPAERRSR